MVKLLYQIFVFEQNNGKSSISFDRVKRLISNNVNEFNDNKQNYNYLFKLLKLGIIDKVEENKYSLSNTVLITNPNNNIAIGVNIPHNVLLINHHLIKDQYLGLTIFKDIKINCDDFEIHHSVFDFDRIINELSSLYSIINYWDNISLNEVGKISKLEKYNPFYCKWENSKEIIENNRIYKLNLYFGNFFKYLFFFKNKYYLIEPFEYEKVNTLKLVNNNKSLFKYNKSSKVLKLKKYYPYPVYLYKIFLLNHIMNIGEIPLNNQFKIELKQFLKITSKLNLNYNIE